MSAKKKNQQTAGLEKAEGYYTLDLRLLKANTYQSRGHGVIPGLNKAGYGLYQPIEGNADKDPIMSMLLSTVPEKMAEGVGLIDQFEPDIKELATGIASVGQLHNIGVQPLEDGGYDVVYGQRRSISRAYNHARSGGTLPAIVNAHIAEGVMDPNDLRFQAIGENRGRRDESPIDEMRMFLFLKKNGVKTKDIALRMGENEQNVRNRLQLARLTPEEQERVHSGKLGMVNALKMLKERDTKGKDAAPAQDIPETRHRMPTYKQALALLRTTTKPETTSDAEWALQTSEPVRQWVSILCDTPYQTFETMVAEVTAETAKADAEAKALADKKATEKAEKDALKAKEKEEKAALKAKEKEEKEALKAKQKEEEDALKAKQKADEEKLATTDEAIAAK